MYAMIESDRFIWIYWNYYDAFILFDLNLKLNLKTFYNDKVKANKTCHKNNITGESLER